MASIINKIFGRKRKEYFILPNEPSFKDSFEFTKPDDAVINKMEQHLTLLKEHKGEFIVEKPIGKKSFIKVSNVLDLISRIREDLEKNYIDYTTEFANESLGFVYYLGTEILFSNSVEIVQKIYHKERNDIGDIHFFLVVKANKGEFYYWPW